MIPLRLPCPSRPRAFPFGKSFTLAVVLSAALFSGAPRLVGAWPNFVKGPAKTAPKKSGPGNKPADDKVPPVPTTPEFADAFPSERRPVPADLLLSRAEEKKADALSRFADALVAEDNAEADAALAGYRKTLEADPGYVELAIKVAYELAKRNDVAAGIQTLKDAIKAAPKDERPLIYLSQLYSKNLKKPDLALRYVEQALALAPNNFAAYLAAFEIHIASEQLKKAEQILERAGKINTTDPQFWVQLGDLQTRLYLKEDGSCQPGELEKMNAVYRKAALLGHEDAAVLTRVGDYFIVSRQVKEAVPQYLAALKLKPSAEEAPTTNLREKLARALIITDQRDEAIHLLEEITKENPTRFETFELLGELYEQKGDTDRSIANYEHSLELDASEPRNHLRLAEMFLKAKRYEQAVATMQTARARFPDRPEITFSYALTLSSAKKHTRAMTVFAEALAEAQNSHEEMLTAQFYFQYGAAAEQAGLLDKAEELINRSIELEPENAAQAYNYLGYMWADRGEKLDQAGELLRKALDLDPDNGAFLDSLGWLYFKKGDYQSALKELLRASETIKPEDAVVFDHLGDTYLALGKKGEALTYWQKALALDKDDKKVAAKIEGAKQKMTSAGAVAPAP